MYIEYYINSIDEKDDEIKASIDTISRLPLSGIIAPYYHAKLLKKLYNHVDIGSFIDYPLPTHNIEQRLCAIKDSIDIGIKYIAITTPHYYIVNRKYTKFREDIKQNLELCASNNIQLRYILEYRKFDHQLLTKICEILIGEGVDCVYPSSGFFLDNIEDNIIACAYLNSKTGIKTIINGNIWKKNQIENILKIKPYGISTNQTNSLNLVDLELYDK